MSFQGTSNRSVIDNYTSAGDLKNNMLGESKGIIGTHWAKASNL